MALNNIFFIFYKIVFINDFNKIKKREIFKTLIKIKGI